MPPVVALATPLFATPIIAPVIAPVVPAVIPVVIAPIITSVIPAHVPAILTPIEGPCLAVVPVPVVADRHAHQATRHPTGLYPGEPRLRRA